VNPMQSSRQRTVGVFLVLFILGAGWVTLIASDDPAVVRFGILADLHAHDVDSPLEGKRMTNTAERLAAFTEAMNGWDADFVVELGDFVNGWVVLGAEPGDPARIPDILAWAETLYATFDGPRYHVIGNHDVYNLDKEQYRTILGIDSTFYSFDVAGYHFVVLDVQFAEDGSDLAHTYTGVAGFVPDEELDWLRSDLDTSDAPTIVLVHQPLDDFIEAWGRPTVANQDQVRAVLAADGDVLAVFQGHEHENAHQVLDGIHYVTFEAMVDQDTPPSWAAVAIDVRAGILSVEGQGAQADYLLTVPAEE